MATYVNDLRLKEIATGDEAGTWGTSTNTNLQLIGEALGYGTQDCFASDADSTTTVADGASDPARAMYFKVTSSATLTATRTLTIAPNTVSRVMIIENATTGSQSIAISQGSGGNVTIASGQTKMVYLDGAGSGGAVVDALADLELGTITVADLTATTADINGGTIDGVTIGGASAGAGTFTTLNATGGGALTGTWSDLGTVTTVDINGGTIDGVTIGGASAGAITGTTGQFNTSLNVDGTVTADDSVVIEGTSPKIFLNETDTTDVNTRIRNAFGSLQIQSVDDSDGSPVTRLGIDHSTGDISFYDSAGSSQSFFWDASAESLQLGSTTSDESSLFAYKNSATYPAITVRQDGSAPIQRWLGASGAEQMRLNSTGLGIGTSTPATQLAVALPSGTNGDIISMARSGGAYNFNLGLDANSTWYVANASDEKILNVAYTGNVGIGTSSPNVLGHFYKGSSGRTWTPDGADVLAIENSDSIVLDIRTPNSNQGLILFSDSDARGRGIVGYAHSSDHMYFNTAGSERMRIDSNGRVLVGTSTVVGTNSRLNILGAAADTFAVGISGQNTATGAPLALNRTSASDGALITFYKNWAGSGVGSIGTGSGAIYIGSESQTSGISFFGTAIYPNNGGTISATDGANDIGAPTARWKDLYLSGGVYLGGTGAANKLDDYEEGTWTPTYSGATTAGTGTYAFQEGSYTKVGNLVTINGYFRSTAHTGTGNIDLTGLPFTVSGGTNNYGVISVGETFNLTISNDTYLTGYVLPSTTTARLRQISTQSTTSTASVAMDTAFDLLFTIVYRTA